MRLVLDASAAVNAVIPSTQRDEVRRRLLDADLCAPALIDTEVLSALARLERGAAITTREADRAVGAWARLPCTRFPVEEMLEQVWRARHALRVSDAHYVTLALALGAPLLTSDKRLARVPVAGLSIVTVG